MNKVVRLPDGRFITRRIVESDPAAIARAKPEEIWTMNDGKSNSGKTKYTREILLRDMEPRHLMNAMQTMLKMAEGRMQALCVSGSTAHEFALKMYPQYSAMQHELDTRLGKKQRTPEKLDDKTERHFDFNA